MTRYLVAAVLALLVLPVTEVAAATPPTPVTISVATTIPPGPTLYDPFASTGGVVCAGGSVSTLYEQFTGWESGFKAQLRVGKHFVCDDGTFDVTLRVTLDFLTGGTDGTWSVLRGSGAYTKLLGTGTIDGTRTSPSTVQDAYQGDMHLD